PQRHAGRNARVSGPVVGRVLVRRRVASLDRGAGGALGRTTRRAPLCRMGGGQVRGQLALARLVAGGSLDSDRRRIGRVRTSHPGPRDAIALGPSEIVTRENPLAYGLQALWWISPNPYPC